MAKSAISTPNVAQLPTLKPGMSLVPAKIGRLNATSTIIYIECPTTWCTVDHVAEPVVSVEDIAHEGDDFGTVVPSVIDGYSEIQMYARIYSDPASEDPRMRDAHLLVGNGTGPDAQMTPDQAEQWVDEVISFAAKVRNTIRVCRSAGGQA